MKGNILRIYFKPESSFYNRLWLDLCEYCGNNKECREEVEEASKEEDNELLLYQRKWDKCWEMFKKDIQNFDPYTTRGG